MKSANVVLLHQIMDFSTESWPPNRVFAPLMAFSDSSMSFMDLIHYLQTHRRKDYDPGYLEQNVLEHRQFTPA